MLHLLHRIDFILDIIHSILIIFLYFLSNSQYNNTIKERGTVLIILPHPLSLIHYFHSCQETWRLSGLLKSPSNKTLRLFACR